MRIAALTCRSYYSLLRGAVSAQRLVKKAKEYGYGAVALADVNAMYGAVDFCKAAEHINIPPIIGVEIITDSQRAVLLAEDGLGYKNLCRITTARNLCPSFDLTEQLRHNNKGIISICDQPELLRAMKTFLDRDCLFAGCRKPGQAERAKANGIRPIAHTIFNIIENDDISIAGLLTKIRQLSVAGPGPEDNCGYNQLIRAEQLEHKFRDCPEAIHRWPPPSDHRPLLSADHRPELRRFDDA